MDKIDPEQQIQSVAQLDRTFLDSMDQPAMSVSQWSKLCILIVVLRAARKMSPHAVAANLTDTTLGDRLAYTSRYQKPATSPRDAYSAYVTRQIQEAAKAEIGPVIERVRGGAARLKDLQKPHVSQPAILSPADRTLLDLAQGRPVAPAVFSRYLRDARCTVLTFRSYITGADIGDDAIIHASHLIASGWTKDDVRKELRISRRVLDAMFTHCPEFLDRLSRYETESVAAVVDGTKRRRAEDEELWEASIPPVQIGDDIDKPTELWRRQEDQLRRRLHVLRIWDDKGIPLSRFGDLSFGVRSILTWEEPVFGIAPLNRNFYTYRRAHPESMMDITTVARSLTARYGKYFRQDLAKKTATKVLELERILLQEDWSALPPNFHFSFTGWLQWDDPSRSIHKLSSSGLFVNDKRYGPIAKRAKELLRAIELKYRALRSEPARHAAPLVDIMRPSEVARMLCPTMDELTPFMAILGLICQIDYSSLKTLRRDCLESSANGYVNIKYRKSRDNDRLYTQRERDGGIDTPGGLIRLILELTEPAHIALKSSGDRHQDYLWLASYRAGFRLCTFQHPVRHPWWRFCDRNIIISDDGKMLDGLEPSRFRKTVKAHKYTKSGGDIFALADDHSYAVARDHYANLPSLEELHDEAVVSGLGHALADAAARVIAGNEPPSKQAARLSEATGQPFASCLAAIQGSEDVWLAGCVSFHSSPFGLPGEACPAPFSECLHCNNGIFTSRKLPNLLRYACILRERRQTVHEDVWRTIYKPDLDRIELQILPQFTAEQIARATTVIHGAADHDPLFMPPSVGLTS